MFPLPDKDICQVSSGISIPTASPQTPVVDPLTFGFFSIPSQPQSQSSSSIFAKIHNKHSGALSRHFHHLAGAHPHYEPPSAPAFKMTNETGIAPTSIPLIPNPTAVLKTCKKVIALKHDVEKMEANLEALTDSIDYKKALLRERGIYKNRDSMKKSKVRYKSAVQRRDEYANEVKAWKKASNHPLGKLLYAGALGTKLDADALIRRGEDLKGRTDAQIDRRLKKAERMRQVPEPQELPQQDDERLAQNPSSTQKTEAVLKLMELMSLHGDEFEHLLQLAQVLADMERLGRPKQISEDSEGGSNLQPKRPERGEERRRTLEPKVEVDRRRRSKSVRRKRSSRRGSSTGKKEDTRIDRFCI